MASKAFLQQAYLAYFGRPADPSGLAYYAEKTEAQVKAAFSASPESQAFFGSMAVAAQINAIYQNLFNRDAEPAGLTYWAQEIGAGRLSLADAAMGILAGAQNDDKTAVANKLAASDSFTTALNTTAEILGYAGAAAIAPARAYLKAVDATAATLTTAVAGVDASVTTVITAGSAVAGQTFTLTTGTDTGAAFTGTSGNDTFTADDGTFTAFDSIDGGAGTDTLTVTEIGGAVTTASKTVVNIETATLRSDDDKVTANTTAWTGLTTLNVTNAGDDVTVTAAATTAVNISNVTDGAIVVTGGMGVTISDSSSTAADDVTVTTAASTTVSLTDVTTTGGDVAITDSSTNANVLTTVVLDGVDGDADSQMALTGDAITNITIANSADGVDLDNGNSNGFTLNLTLDDNTGIVVTDTNGFAETVAVTMVSDSDLELNAAGATAITVAGEGVVTLTEGAVSGLNAVETITVSGAAGITVDLTDLGALTAFDGANTSGDITISDADATVADLAISTGSGDDDVTTSGALDAGAVIDLGAGDDTYRFDTAAAAGAAVDGGTGTNTLVVADGSLLSADAYTNFQVLEVGGGTGTYDMSTLPDLSAVTLTDDVQTGNILIDNAAAGTTVEFISNSGADFDVSDDGGTGPYFFEYALEDASATDDEMSMTLTVNDGNDDGNADGYVWIAGTLTVDGVETVNITSTVGTLDADDAATAGVDESTAATEYTNYIDDLQMADATTLNITATAALDFTDAAGSITADALETINVSGAGDVTFGTLTAAAALTKVDAHSATGAIDIDVSDAGQSVEFLGGSGDDTYVGSAFGDTINAGDGADDITLETNGLTFAVIDTIIVEAGASVLNDTADGHDVITGFGTAAGAGALDVIDLGTFGFTGTAASALANKGALANAVVDGSTLEQANFFSSGGFDRGVAIGTNGGDTYVFIDANKDGDFNAADDVVIQLAGVTDVTLSNFGF